MSKNYLSEIDERFPVRNSAAQKEAFRDYALSEAAESGFSRAAREENGGHVNLVFGDPGSARVIFTAHYDTPRRALVPNLMLVTNKFLSYGYKFGIPLIMLALAVGAAYGAKSLLGLDFALIKDRMLMLAVYLSVYFALFFLLLLGPANRHNRNDNTSGTAAVLEIMRIRGDQPGTAYILFDDEEKGKKGSKAYAAAHPEIKEGTLIVNMDCVGNGDTFIFSASDGAECGSLYAEMQNAAGRKGLTARFLTCHQAKMNSDHRSFDKSVGVCACRYKPFVGYFTGKIHTVRDTEADPETVRKLAEALADFATVSSSV